MRDLFFIGDGRSRSSSSDAGQPAINAPFLVLLLIGLLMGVHLMRTLLAPEFDQQLMLSFSMMPVRLSHYAEPVIGIGDVKFLFGPEARWITIVTHVFLHADFLHLLLNSVWILAVGAPVARRIGQMRFLLFFFMCAAAGALAYYLRDPSDITPLYGASAASAGLMGGAVRFAFSRVHTSRGTGSILSWPTRLALPLAPIYDSRVIGFTVLWTLLILTLGLGGTHIFGEGYDLAWQTYLASFFAGLVLFPLFDPHRPLRDDFDE